MLVLDKTQLNSDDGLRHAAPFLHPVHLNHLLLSFTPDEYPHPKRFHSVSFSFEFRFVWFGF